MQGRENDEPEPGFRHSPLPDAGTYIRLLEVQTVVDAKLIECRLTVWPIESAPDYHAVSYTWGNPAETSVIKIDEEPLVVRQNCEYVLRQASELGRCRYHWVDAICINQDDNSEKSHQVQMMGSIFGRASCVLACVGAHSDDSELLLRTLGKCAYSFTLPTRSNPHDALTWSRSSRWRVRKWMYSVSSSEMQKLLKALMTFMERPFFSRVWIMQELYLATNVDVCCGDIRSAIQTLYGFCLLITEWQSPFYISLRISLASAVPVNLYTVRMIVFECGRWLDKHIYPLVDHIWLLRRLRPQGYKDCPEPRLVRSHNDRWITRASSAEHKPMPLLEAIMGMKDLLCSEAKDKVYAVLSLVDWSGLERIRPDYSKSTFDVAVEVLRTLEKVGTPLQNGQTARFLVAALKLNIENAAVEAEVHMQRLLSGGPGVIHTKVDARAPDSSTIQILARGWRILYDTTWKLDFPEQLSNYREDQLPSFLHQSRLLSLRSEHKELVQPMEGYLDIWTDDDNVIVRVSDTTKPGDWLLKIVGWSLGITVRKQQDGNHTIVGPAVMSQRLDLKGSVTSSESGLPRTSLFFDAETVVILAALSWSLAHGAKPRFTAEIPSSICSLLQSDRLAYTVWNPEGHVGS